MDWLLYISEGAWLLYVSRGGTTSLEWTLLGTQAG